MTNDPNFPPPQPFPQGPQQPPYGQYPQQGYGQHRPYPPQHQHGPFPPQGFGPPPPQPPVRDKGPQPPKGPLGPSFWIVGGLLALIVLSNTAAGNGESILVMLGLAALLTGLYSLIFKRKSWAALPSRNAAIAVAVAGAAALLFGGIAAGVSSSRDSAAEPVTSATLEADAAVKLKAREDALVKSEAESAAKLAEREEAVKKAEAAVKAREIAVTGTEKTAAANTIGEGVWTVGKDMPPGDYRTTKAVSSSCYWSITRTGSNGGDIIENDIVPGGFPMVTLTDGQTFKSTRCGEWKKQ
jgi:hypothetical protein